MDDKTGNHGPYLPENITRILSIRDAEASTARGRAAWLLARLDRMFFEGSLPCSLNAARIRLFKTLLKSSSDESTIADEISTLGAVSLAPPDTLPPLIEWAYRILSATEPIVARNRLDGMEWSEFVSSLQERVDYVDFEGLAALLRRISFSGVQ